MFTEEHGLFGRIKNLFGTNTDEKVSDVMATKRVVGFDEEKVSRPTSFADIVNEPISTSPPVSLRTVAPSAPTIQQAEEENLDIEFAQKFTAQGGNFIYCETLADMVEVLKDMKTQNQWDYIFSWENEINDIFTGCNFQRGAIGFTIKNSDAVISLCESLVADDGSIIFNPKQSSRRTLTCFPEWHIVLADATCLTSSLATGLQRFQQQHKLELPAVLKLDDNSNTHFYNNNHLVLRADGTKNIFLIFVDETIPPSLRP